MFSFCQQEERHHKDVRFYHWLPNFWNNRPDRIRVFSSNLELKGWKGWRSVVKGKKNASLWKRCAPLWQPTGTKHTTQEWKQTMWGDREESTVIQVTDWSTCTAFKGLFLVFPTMDSCMCLPMEVRVDKASGAGVTESWKLPCRC